MLNPGIIIPYIGLNASIPAGFVREATLDSKFPKATANAVDPNNTGGAATHTHTSPAHSHTLNAHTHTYTTSQVNETDDASNNAGSVQGGNHMHSGTTDNGSGGTTSSDAVTYSSYSNNPPFYDVIFIRAISARSVPNNGIVLLNSSSIPAGYYQCDGGNSTVDLRNKYLHGAAAGADSGATGGSTTNIHDISHSHTAQGHTHGGTTGNSDGYGGDNNNAGSNDVKYPHTHTISTSSNSQGLNGYSGSLTTPETVEPAYKKLLAIQNKSGIGKNVLGQIALWLGSLTTIPIGWKLCDGNNNTPDMRDKYLKIANDGSEIGNTGGANTHTHAAQSHGHTASGTHSHTGSTSAHLLERQLDGSGTAHALRATTAHTFTTSSDQATYANANTTANSASNEPEYRTVAYIQMVQDVSGGSFLFNFI